MTGLLGSLRLRIKGLLKFLCPALLLHVQAPGVNAMAAASAASGPPAGGPDRPDRGTATVSMAGPVMDGPNLIVGQNRPRDRGGNDHVSPNRNWAITS